MGAILRGTIEGGATGTGATGVTTTGNGDVEEGDAMFLWMWGDQVNEDWAVMVGQGADFTKGEEIQDGTNPSSTIQYKIAGDSEPANYTANTGSGNSAGRGIIGIVLNPNGGIWSFDDNQVNTDTASDTTLATESVTVIAGVDNVGILLAFGANRDNLTIATPPSDMTIIGQLLNTGTTPSVGGTAGVGYYKLNQAAGAVSKTFVWSANGVKSACIVAIHLIAGSSPSPGSRSIPKGYRRGYRRGYV